jgi:hypothetical protein
MKIIGFSAKKQGGKDTSVNYLVNKLGEMNVLVVRFADQLKNIVRLCFIPPDWDIDFNSDMDKSRVLPCGKTVRAVLQVVGTDYFRTLWPDVWVNALANKLSACVVDTVLIPDVRFPNEVKAIQEMGGKVIRFTRAPFADEHESETALDGFEEFDAVIDNSQMSIPEQNEAIWTLLNEKGWL